MKTFTKINLLTVLSLITLVFTTNLSFGQTYSTKSEKMALNTNDGKFSKKNDILYSFPNDIYAKDYLSSFIVNSKYLNLRKGPASSYPIIERLNRFQELVFLAEKDGWVKVRIKSSDTIGFVYYKYLVPSTEKRLLMTQQ